VGHSAWAQDRFWQYSTPAEKRGDIPKKPSRFGLEISLWVDFFGPIYFPFAAHGGHSAWAQDRFWRNSTPAEKRGDIPKKPSRFGPENSLWDDFFGPIYFPFAAHGGHSAWA
jgi:hypothetical protein